MPAASTVVRPGFRSGRLTVLELAAAGSKRRPRRWRCVCDCGVIRIVRTDRLQHQQTQSCGCFRRDRASRLNLTHGHSTGGGNQRRASATYRSWKAMRDRCRQPSCRGYERYGGRGIRVCERWDGPEGFANFLADMGERPSEGHSIDRIDNDGNYEPANCRWATRSQQEHNKRNRRARAALEASR